MVCILGPVMVFGPNDSNILGNTTLFGLQHLKKEWLCITRKFFLAPADG